MVISRQVLSDVGQHLTKLDDELSKNIAHYTLEKVIYLKKCQLSELFESFLSYVGHLYFRFSQESFHLKNRCLTSVNTLLKFMKRNRTGKLQPRFWGEFPWKLARSKNK